MTKEINWPEVVAMANRHPDWSNYRLADAFEVNESTIRRGLASRGFQRYLLPTDLDFEDGLTIELDKPIVHKGDLAVTADWHIPVYDPAYVNKFILDARDRGHKKLLIAGDFFNFDALSAYTPKQDEAGLQVELTEAIAVMKVLLETFDHIYYVWGNHDARLHRALGFTIQFREAMRLVFGSLGEDALKKITFTNLDHMWVETEEGQPDYYICHPKNYTRLPLATARQMASKYNAHVVTAHSHHCAVGYGPDGEKVVAEIGGLFDRKKTAYLQRSTTFPTWSQGYAFIENGRLIVDSPGWSTK